MINILRIAAFILLVAAAAVAQTEPAAEPQIGDEITGMYSFVREGEFAEIEVDDGKVTGVVSRFKDDDPEKAEFVDQFFEEAKLEGSRLSFRTRPAGGVWFEFSGVVERGAGKTPSDEGYWNIRGTLTVRRTSNDGNVTQKTSELTLRSFPQEPAAPGPESKEKQ
ncbi:MAG: hypothetical protein WA532_01170 [Candidatus Korobacteraceae bacterium]